jgi:malonyl-CoA/methylmalonyl-CoA synthetase
VRGLLATLADPPDRPALVFGDQTLSYAELGDAVGALSAGLGSAKRVAVWAAPTPETVVGVIATLASGAAVVPINPKAGQRELEHVLSDAQPDLLLAGPDAEVAETARALPIRRVELRPRPRQVRPAAPRGTNGSPPDPDSVAIVLYTSGTTGPPKGVLLPHRALESNLDALAEVWRWTASDRLVHALPLFHIHGLVLGTLGPLRLGGTLEHVGRFSPLAVAAALERGGTMLFGVPTMYNRLAADAERDPRVAAALRGARLLVSGSAALPAALHARLGRVLGQRVVERYGMSETVMIASAGVDGDRRPGYVGPPLPGVEVRLIDDDGQTITADGDDTIGEVAVRGPNLFLGYLNRPDATREAMRDGWFLTGDLATRAADGYLRLVGRRSTDLIKSGGYKIGAVEVESALLEHAAVAEVAVTGEPDEDLGERVVAWVVLHDGHTTEPRELIDLVARLLSPHKRPRQVHFVATLPRNELGKVRKRDLHTTATP